jgi:hypothetical protein
MSHSFNGKIHKPFFFVGTAVIALSLGACSTVEPNFLPKGYAHHGKVYKSQTPPPSQRVTNDQRAHMGPVQAEQFRTATYDILSRLTGRAGLPPKPAYIDAANPMTPFYANIDNDLREAMRSQGYRLSEMAEGSYIFKYKAELLPGYRSYDLESAPTGAPNIKLTLDVLTDIQGTMKVLTHEVGNYYIQGAEDLLILSPTQKSLPLENSTRYLNEAGAYEPRTENTYHSSAELNTVQPVMDKTKTPVMSAPIMREPAPMAPAYVQPIQPEYRISEPVMSPATPSEYVVTMPSEPPVMVNEEPIMPADSYHVPSMNGDGAGVEIYDPATSEMTGSYDYSASMNDMSDTAPVRRGPRISKQVEY